MVNIDYLSTVPRSGWRVTTPGHSFLGHIWIRNNWVARNKKIKNLRNQNYTDRVPYFPYLTKTLFSLILQIWQLQPVFSLPQLRSQILLVPTNWLMIFSFSTFDNKCHQFLQYFNKTSFNPTSFQFISKIFRQVS